MPRATVAGVEDYRVEDGTVALACRVTVEEPPGEYALPERTHPVRVEFLAPDAFRFEFEATPEVESTTTLDLDRAAVSEPVTLETREEDGALYVATAALELEFGLADWTFCVRDAEGRVLVREQREDFSAKSERRATPLGFDAELTNRWPYRATEAGTAFVLHGDEHVYGLGEKFTEFDKRGQRVLSWVTQPNGAETESAYKNVPFYLSTRGYGLLVDTTQGATFDVGESSTVSTGVAVDDDTFAFVFLHGPEFPDVLQRYTALTGRPGRVPKWSLGTWMSRLGYESRAELEDVTDRLRAEGMPCDVVHLDPPWLREGGLCDLEFDTDAFPDPEGMIEGLHEDGFRLCLWEYPYLLTSSPAFEEALDRGLFVQDGTGAPYVLSRVSWSDDRGAILDFTNPETVEWWQDRHRDLLAMGVDAFKTDFGEYLPEDAVLHNGHTGRAMRNTYPNLYTEAVYEVMAAERGRENALLWARSGWAGGQACPVHWGGDPYTSFEALAASLRGGLSLALSGYAFWSSDIGGFRGEPSTELYVRWAQAGLLGMSHARFHGTTPREPWAYGENALEIVRAYARERYRLLPYLWTHAELAARRGHPVMRPLVFEFQDDAAARACGTQLMLGPALLAAPVLSAGGRVSVTLPPGEWVDYWTGERVPGGHTLDRTVDLDTMPLYLRAGHVVPRREPRETVDPEPPETLELLAALDASGAASGEYYDEATDSVVAVEVVREGDGASPDGDAASHQDGDGGSRGDSDGGSREGKDGDGPGGDGGGDPGGREGGATFRVAADVTPDVAVAVLAVAAAPGRVVVNGTELAERSPPEDATGAGGAGDAGAPGDWRDLEPGEWAYDPDAGRVLVRV